MGMDFSKASGNKIFKTVEKNNEEKLNVQKILNIPISQIDEDEINEQTFHIDRVDGFAKAIDNMGFQGAITVYEKPDGRYKISSGHRRYRAMKELKKSTIPAIILKPVSRPEEVRNLILSNTNNRVMTPLDWANAINQYINEYLIPTNKLTNKKKDVARDLNLSETQVQRYLNVLKLIPELQTLCADDNYPFTAIASASKLNEEQQRELYRIIISKSSNGEKIYRDEVLSIIAHMKNPESENLNTQQKSPEDLMPKEDFRQNIEEAEISINEQQYEAQEPDASEYNNTFKKSPEDLTPESNEQKIYVGTESLNVEDELPILNSKSAQNVDEMHDSSINAESTNEPEIVQTHNGVNTHTIENILSSIQDICKMDIGDLQIQNKEQALNQVEQIIDYLCRIEDRIKSLK